MQSSPSTPSPFAPPPRLRPRTRETIRSVAMSERPNPAGMPALNQMQLTAINFDIDAHEEPSIVQRYRADRKQFTASMWRTFGPEIIAHTWNLRYMIDKLSLTTVLEMIAFASEQWADEHMTMPAYDAARQQQYVIQHGQFKYWLPTIKSDHSGAETVGDERLAWVEKINTIVAPQPQNQGTSNDEDEPQVTVYTIPPRQKEEETASTASMTTAQNPRTSKPTG